MAGMPSVTARADTNASSSACCAARSGSSACTVSASVSVTTRARNRLRCSALRTTSRPHARSLVQAGGEWVATATSKTAFRSPTTSPTFRYLQRRASRSRGAVGDAAHTPRSRRSSPHSRVLDDARWLAAQSLGGVCLVLLERQLQA